MPAELYLKENIDEQITIKPWLKKNSFPIFLRDSYNFYEVTILGTKCILVEAVDEMPNVDQLQKHIKQIKNLTDRQVVLFYRDITRYRRKSLIENRIAFVIEDRQMYLPFLGLDYFANHEFQKMSFISNLSQLPNISLNNGLYLYSFLGMEICLEHIVFHQALSAVDYFSQTG